MAPENGKTPQYLVELAAAGELPAAERAAVLARLAREEGGQERLDALPRDDAATLARLPSAAVAAEVERRAGARPRPGPGRPRRAWLLVPVLAGLGAASVAVLPALRSAPEQADGTRLKGSAPHLVVHRQTAAGEERLAPGAAARAGDLLQLGYVSAGEAYGVVVSIDGRGEITRHLPADGAGAAPLTAGREVLLPESYRLDDAPAFERFVLVTSPRAFAVSAVLDAARAVAARRDARDAPLPLPPGLAEASLLVVKEVR